MTLQSTDGLSLAATCLPTCRGQSLQLNRYGPGSHIRNVSAETPCAPFHEPFPQKRSLLRMVDALIGSVVSVKYQATPCSRKARAAELPLRFPPVPGGIPAQHDANGFLEQSKVASLARRTRRLQESTMARRRHGAQT